MNQIRARYYTENFAATHEELSMLRPEGCSDTSFYIQLLQLRGRISEESLYCGSIREACGKTEGDIQQDLAFIRSTNPPISVSLESYYKYGAYTLDVLNEKDALIQWADRLNRYLYLRDDIIQKFETERMSFSAFEKELEEARGLLSEILSVSRKKMLVEAIKDVRPDLLENTAEFNRIAVNMELSVSVLGFEPEEYAAYHFWEKPIPERLEYVSDRLRKTVGSLLNSEAGFDVLNNKYLTYQALKPLYGRSIRQMNADGGYQVFAEAFRENSVLVKKNNFQSLGREVEKIEATGNTDLHALYERITQNGKYFILEDLIEPHPDMKRLNPDSVNTVRVVTFREQEDAVVLYAALRTGRSGSFVDNAGRGGIFVNVDPAKGITDSHGVDKKGFVYESHPDHAYRFCGIRLPLWEEALETAKKAARTTPCTRYVGWDLACTKENRWIIVEGNGMPMYDVHQAPLGVGKRKELMDAIHYERLVSSKPALNS
ncbi:MAG: hypothetical protein IJM06_06545 [Firmicutes bacterium]|nr:hypothetical protein [Bacillota bacterium]